MCLFVCPLQNSQDRPKGPLWGRRALRCQPKAGLSAPIQNSICKEETAEDEMLIHINGPEIGENDNTLKSALFKHFQGQSLHFIVKENIFRSSGITVENILF